MAVVKSFNGKFSNYPAEALTTVFLFKELFSELDVSLKTENGELKKI